MKHKALKAHIRHPTRGLALSFHQPPSDFRSWQEDCCSFYASSPRQISQRTDVQRNRTKHQTWFIILSRIQSALTRCWHAMHVAVENDPARNKHQQRMLFITTDQCRHFTFKIQGVHKSSLTNFHEISRTHFKKNSRRFFKWQAIQYQWSCLPEDLLFLSFS